MAHMEQTRHGRAAILADRPRSEVITDYDVNRALNLIGGVPVEDWKTVDRRIRESGDPTFLQGFAGAEQLPLPNALAAVTGSAAETAAWTAATWTPITAGPTLQTPKGYVLRAAGTITSTGAGQTVIVTPRIGTSTGGATLGATGATALGSTITNAPWYLEVLLTVQRSGTGTNATALANARFFAGQAASAATTAIGMNTSTSATFDSTTTTALFIGTTASATAVSYVTNQILWASYN